MHLSYSIDSFYLESGTKPENTAVLSLHLIIVRGASNAPICISTFQCYEKIVRITIRVL